MNVFEAIILGIVQGLTEFLPVSSSGHIELGKALFNVQTTDNLLFSIVVHGATALSTIMVFRKDILSLLAGLLKFQNNEELQYSLKILLSMIPVGIIGVLYVDQIESLFTGNVLLVGSMLIITGALLIFTVLVRKNYKNISYGRAFIIGMAQAVAIIPGISRSGATISTALLLGVDKEKAARFSFLMVIIPIVGATLLKVKDYLEEPAATSGGISSTVLLAGFISAFIFGYIACSWMIELVKKGKLIYFAYYCIGIGLISIIITLL